MFNKLKEKIAEYRLFRKLNKALAKMKHTNFRIPDRCSQCELLYVDKQGNPSCTSEHACIHAKRRLALDDRETKQSVSNRGSKMR